MPTNPPAMPMVMPLNVRLTVAFVASVIRRLKLNVPRGGRCAADAHRRTGGVEYRVAQVEGEPCKGASFSSI
jgi:hypothetical protein